jgi:protein-tyrosine phosphatase
MKTEVYWIDEPAAGCLAVMARPRGGDWLEDEIAAWRSAGIDIVVSLLTASEIAEMDMTQEASLAAIHGMEFRAFPISDRGVPISRPPFKSFVMQAAEDIAAGKSIAIHCRQGLGRAPLVAIAILMVLGVEFDAAVAAVAKGRGCPVPETTEQKRWLSEFFRDLPLPARG